ncbi:hypothetical protein [Nocardioides sp.]|uniref:hypothetical protein n=1 Tax=Nocardioides sp. TaxID=35761 RepID=UPI003565DD3A
MSATTQDLVHFFSYRTGVSIELPVGFESVTEDESSVTYAVLDEDGAAGPRDPQMHLQVVGEFEEDATDADRTAAVRALADGFAGVDGELLGRADRLVDEEPTATVTLRRPDADLLLHLTAAAHGSRLLSIVASTSEEAMLSSYDDAVASIRFIDL